MTMMSSRAGRNNHRPPRIWRRVLILLGMALAVAIGAFLLFRQPIVDWFTAPSDAVHMLTSSQRRLLREPSGITFADIRDTFFVISDDGVIAEMTRDGKILRLRQTGLRDLEGISFNEVNHLLYLADERDQLIVEMDPETLDPLRTFAIDPVFNNVRWLTSHNNGIEGITFVPDAGHPHGGTFFIVIQGFTENNQRDHGTLIELDIPLREPGAQIARIRAVHRLGLPDLSSVHYNHARDQLLIVSDARNLLLTVDRRTGAILARTHLPGRDQEGVSFVDEQWLYVAQDSGGVIRLRWQPVHLVDADEHP